MSLVGPVQCSVWLTCRYGNCFDSEFLIGDDTFPSRTAALISSFNRWYTRGMERIWSMVIRITDAVVSDPAMNMNSASVSHSGFVRPWRMNDPYFVGENAN
jgi:hypothetical protein